MAGPMYRLSRITRAATAACVLCCTLATASCNIVAPVAMIIEGPPKADAVAELDKSRPTVFFIDDRDSVLPKRSLRDDIGTTAERTLLARKVMTQRSMIAAQDARRVAASERAGQPMSVVDVGRRVGAEVVVHVNMDIFRITAPDGFSLSPIGIASVMVYDTVSNEVIWPESGEPYTLDVRLPARPGMSTELSLSERAARERDLAQRVGMRLARMFYTAERDRNLGE